MAILGASQLGNGALMVSVDHNPTTTATDCPKGSLILYGGAWYYKLDDGSSTNVVTTLPASFGGDHGFSKADSENSYSGTSNWQTKTTLSKTGLPAGKYHIEWYIELKCSSSSADTKARLYSDSANTHAEINLELPDATNYAAWSGHDEVDLTAGNHTFELQYALEAPGATIYVRRGRISLWRVS